MNILRPRTSLPLLVTALAIALPTLSGCSGTEQGADVAPIAPSTTAAPIGEPGPGGVVGADDIDPSQK